MYTQHTQRRSNGATSGRPRSGFQSTGSAGGRGRFGGSSQRRRPARGMDIHDFIARASVKTEHKVTVNTHQSFHDFDLDERILSIVDARGYTTPTPIQDSAIPAGLAGNDIIGLASTGSGKTAAFLLPIIHKILNDNSQNVIIMEPTRELAQQVESELREFTRGMRIQSVTCVGGMPLGPQIRGLRNHPHIVIGTPGRIADMVNRGELPLHVFQTVVLDEVDHMLDMGFVEPITEIMNSLPAEKQVLFFSATMPTRIRSLTHQFLVNPVTLEIASNSTNHNVEQEIIQAGTHDKKMSTLHGLLATDEYKKVIIFSETKRSVEDLTVALRGNGFSAVSLHGDKHQRDRRRALDQFSNNTVSILVATDVAARGLDIKNVTHVVNYTVPQTFDDYTHRIGRTGRAGAKGKAVTFV